MAPLLTLCGIDRPELLFYTVGKVNPILQDFIALKWERVLWLQHMRGRGSAAAVFLSSPCCGLAPLSLPRTFLIASERLGRDLAAHCEATSALLGEVHESLCCAAPVCGACVDK